MAEDFIIEEQTDAPPQGDPLEKLYKGLVSDGKYTKSYDEFKKKYSSKADIDFLYSGLSADKDYTKSKDDFYDQYFPAVKKKETFNSGNPHSYLNLFGKKSEQPSGISSPTQLELLSQGEKPQKLPNTTVKSSIKYDPYSYDKEGFNKKVAEHLNAFNDENDVDPVKTLVSKKSPNFDDELAKNTAIDVAVREGVSDGIQAKEILAFDNDGTNETNNRLQQHAAEVAARYEDVAKDLRGVSGTNAKPLFYQAAIKKFAKENKSFAKDIKDLGLDLNDPFIADKIDPMKVGQAMDKYLKDDDVNTYLSRENVDLVPMALEVRDNLLTDNPKYGINQVANKVSQARIRNKNTDVLFDWTGDKDKEETNKIAEEVLSPKELEIYNSTIRNNQDDYLDKPSMVAGVAQGIKDTLKGIKEWGAQLTSSNADVVRNKWHEEAKNVSANPTGALEIFTDTGKMLGLVGTMGATGNALGLAELPATNTVLTFGAEAIKHNREKYNDSPVKAGLGAIIETGMYVALSKNIFPAKDVAQAISKVRPEIGRVIEKLSNGAITKEAARQELQTTVKKVIDLGKGTLSKAAKITAELETIKGITRGLDKINMDAETFKQYHPDDEFNPVHTFLTNIAVAGLAKYGEQKAKDKEFSEVMYNAASNPRQAERLIDQAPNMSANEVRELKSNLNHISKVKENLQDKGFSEEAQKFFIFQSLREKVATENAEKLTDPTLIKKQKEVAKEAHEVKEQVLAGVPIEEIKTETQKKKEEEAEKNKVEIERLTIDNKLDLEKIDAQIEETDGRESEANRIKLKELNEKKKRINEDYQKAVEKLTPKEEVVETEETDLLSKVKEKANFKDGDLQYYIDKAGEDPSSAREAYGKEVADELLSKVPTEKLKENFDKAVEMGMTDTADAIGKELDARESPSPKQTPTVSEPLKDVDVNYEEEKGRVEKRNSDIETQKSKVVSDTDAEIGKLKKEQGGKKEFQIDDLRKTGTEFYIGDKKYTVKKVSGDHIVAEYTQDGKTHEQEFGLGHEPFTKAALSYTRIKQRGEVGVDNSQKIKELEQKRDSELEFLEKQKLPIPEKSSNPPSKTVSEAKEGNKELQSGIDKTKEGGISDNEFTKAIQKANKLRDEASEMKDDNPKKYTLRDEANKIEDEATSKIAPFEKVVDTTDEMLNVKSKKFNEAKCRTLSQEHQKKYGGEYKEVEVTNPDGTKVKHAVVIHDNYVYEPQSDALIKKDVFDDFFQTDIQPKPKTVSEVGDGAKTVGEVGKLPTDEPKNTENQPPTEGEPPIEPPKPPKTEEGEGMDDLDKLANNIPDSGEVAKYMSKDTIEKYTGESPQNDQTRGVQELGIALEHGEKIIQKAQELFGKDYVDKTLEYIENSKAGISNKALMYVSLENALGREKLGFLEDANKVRELTKQQALVYEQSQKFAREYSLALNYQKLRRIAQVGYDIEKLTDNFFSAEEIEAKGKLKEAIEADADAINEEAKKQATAGMTPEAESKIAEGVEKEINKIYESLPSEKKSRAEKLLKALEQVQKKLRGRTYDATLGIPVAIVDAGITTIKHAIKLGASIADAVEAGIKKIKEKLSEHEDWKGKVWENEKQFREDAIEEFKKFAPDVKNIVKEALIKAGFGRTINVKGEEKQLLDWKKLAGRAGTVSKISENVAEVFKKEGKSAEEVDRIKDELVKEYIDLRTSVIEKAQNELAKRNKEMVSPEQKSAAKKLAELYTYGMFEKNVDEFDNLIHKALGTKVSEQGLKEARDIAHAMELIYANSFKGIRLNDISAKAAIERLEDKLRVLLFREAKRQGNWTYKAANMVRNYFEIQQTMLLNNMKQAFENPLSGLQQKVIENINSMASGNTTKELSAQNRKLMKTVYKDMVVKGGIGYGKVESQFVNRQHIDDYVNSLSSNELYHGIASVVTGKATLNAMDAMYKAGLTEKKFTHNLITLLTHPTNPEKMSKPEALKFVSEKLTGQSYKEAQSTAKKIIEQLNKDAGRELIPEHKEMVDRFANDIVKASLEMGSKVTPDMIKAAYGAAYKGAGLGIGHEANNILSSQIKGYSARIEGEINNAIKNKEWNRAAALTMKGVLYRNIINPFVGGGTNWLMLKLEKTGLGLFTGLAYKIGSKQDIDLSSKVGLQRLEARLYNQGRWKDNAMRGLIGGAVTWGSYALALSLMNTDEYEKWRAKNRWAARYLDVITPEPMLLKMAVDKKDPRAIKQYVGQSFNRNDAFSAEEKLVKGVGYAAQGKMDKAWGAWGEMVGSKANAPLPWRLAKDNQVIYQGIKGQDPYHGDYKASSGFANGFFQGGIIEYLGARPKPQVEEGDESFNNEILKADYERTKDDEQKKNYFVANKVQPKITELGEDVELSDKQKETFVKDVETERDKIIDEYFKTRAEEYKQKSDLERSMILDKIQEDARIIAVDKFFKANPEKLEEVKKKIKDKTDQVEKERTERSQ